MKINIKQNPVIKIILTLINNIFTSKSKKQVFSNIFSLSFLQLTNYIFPFIAIPYLIRVLGTDNFGLVMFSQAFIQYFIIFIDFGMEYTITREISVNRYNRKKVAEIFNAVMIIKVIIFLISLIILIAVIFSFNRLSNNWDLYIITFGMVIGQMMFPVWLFQGIEKMKYITIVNVIAKAIFTCLIFFLVKRPSDILLVAFLNSLGYIIAGIISLIIALRIIKFKLYIPPFSAIKSYFMQAKDVFISNFGISLYMTSTPFILGLTTGRNDVVGFYSIAEKTVRGIRYVVSPVTQALFPYLSSKFRGNDVKNSIKILLKLSVYLLPVLLFLMLFLNIFTGWITKILAGSDNYNIINNIRIISVILIIGTLNNIWGILGMVNLRLEKYFRNYVLTGGIFNVLICIFLTYHFLDLGASISIVATELILFILISRKMKQIYSYA
ncbi:MAG: oligosaccharide flippase family protein [Bacteroidales bacterium]